jgi:hypothetical protein
VKIQFFATSLPKTTFGGGAILLQKMFMRHLSLTITQLARAFKPELFQKNHLQPI